MAPAQAADAGIDKKALKAVVALRKRDPAKVAALRETIDAYMASLGQLMGTPLADAALEHAGLTLPV
jgi:hypothetical protein